VPDYTILVLEYGFVETRNHFGRVGDFPNAHVCIQRREITEYRAARALPRRFEFLSRSCGPALPEFPDGLHLAEITAGS
jgi:hypothetical protein